ncbi:phosphoadenosine phosphosulfate reductase family protein [Photobacterium leiognathi]|uniref:phosphoadenosine phosphosulfate reductase family protein n=1 Tax=Photobacterium leiognathi TaxID=553611 RepID=UPI0029826EEF|nr:phosphoadenosine phosphosulfate reductase family protein [Photobacterium leiognathi]
MDNTTLKQRQSLDLDSKIQMTKSRIRQWFDFYDGDVYLSFSGGKDSNVLGHIIKSMPSPYCNIPFVFVNTGLEYPEVLDHVRSLAANGWNIEQIKPERTFKDIWDNDGIPLVSKRVARQIRIARGELGGEQSRNLVLNGVNKKGLVSNSQWKISDKWRYLIDSDVKISDTCCDYLKKKPFIRYEKDTGLKVMTAMMASEGGTRSMISKCNMFDGSRPKSSPMLFWLESDVWEYVNKFQVNLASVYYDRKCNFEGKEVLIKGESRTGCMFCAFGQHLEKGVNKFQKMQVTHPRQYNVIINRMGLSKALDLIDVNYKYDFDLQSYQKTKQVIIMPKKPISSHGGSRPNSGRKKSIDTKLMRVPSEFENDISYLIVNLKLEKGYNLTTKERNLIEQKKEA